jgi:hypothetical protein
MYCWVESNISHSEYIRRRDFSLDGLLQLMAILTQNFTTKRLVWFCEIVVTSSQPIVGAYHHLVKQD